MSAGFMSMSVAEQVGEAQRVVDVHDDAAQLLGQPGRERQRLLDQLVDAADVGVDLDRASRPFSGSGVICARIDVPVRVTTSARTRASPSTMMLMPAGALAIWRMTPTVPIALQVVGRRVVGVVVLQHQQRRMPVGRRARG